MLLLSMAQSLCPNPFLPLKHSWFSLAYCNHHLGEPPNGLKQLKNGSQWGFSNFFFLIRGGLVNSFPIMIIKASLPFIQTRANLKMTTCLTPWGPKPLLLTKNQSLRAPKLNIKTHNQIQYKPTMFYSKS